MQSIRTLTGDPKALLGTAQGGLDVLRLMIATNLLSSLHRHAALRIAAPIPPEERQVSEFGDMVSIIAIAAGVLKEGVDAFWCAEPYLTPLFSKYAGQVDSPRYASFLRSSSKIDQGSVYSTLVRPIRDDAAFHWKRQKLSDYLACVTNTDAAIMTILNDGDKAVTARYVLADLLVSLVMFGNESNDSLSARVRALREFVVLFMNVAEEAIALYLREKGATVRDRPA